MRDILTQLYTIANELDARGAFREADTVTSVMKRVALLSDFTESDWRHFPTYVKAYGAQFPDILHDPMKSDEQKMDEIDMILGDHHQHDPSGMPQDLQPAMA